MVFLYDCMASILSGLAFAGIAFACKLPDTFGRRKKLLIPLAVGGIAGAILPMVGFFYSWKMIQVTIRDPGTTALAGHALTRMSVVNLFVAFIWLFVLWLYRESEAGS